MKNDQPTTERRRFLTLVGGGAAMLPFVGLAACSSEEPAAPTIASSADNAAASRPDPAQPSSGESAMAKAEESAQQSAADTEQMAQNDAGTGGGTDGGLPHLSEDNPQASALEYKHIASDVDNSRYKEGQQCSNCQLWQGSDSDEWAGCGIFAGKAVKNTGWCTAYAAMSA